MKAEAIFNHKGEPTITVYPETEEEMIETLEAHEIEYNPDYDGQFFDTMTKCGWTIRSLPVYDWIATYEARLQVTSPANIF